MQDDASDVRGVDLQPVTGDLQQFVLLMVAVVAVIVLAVGAAVLLHLVRRAGRRGRAHLAIIGAYLGKAEKAIVTHGARAAAQFGGVHYHYRYFPERGLDADRLTVGLACTGAYDMTVRHERPSDALARRIGLVREVQTGDATFDRRYFVDTPVPDFAARLLSDEARRGAISAILAAGFDRVQFDHETVSATVKDISPARPSADELPLGLLLRHLAVLARGLPAVSARLGDARRRAWRARIAFVYTVAALLLVTGFAAGMAGAHFFPALDGGDLVADALVRALAPALAWLVLLVLILRGHSGSLRHFLASAWLSLFGWSVLVAGGMAYANGAWDNSVAVERAPRVLERRRSYGRSPRYWVEVDGWRLGRKRERVYIERDEFRALHPRLPETVLLETRAGYFGYPWIAAYRFPVTLGAHSVAPAAEGALPRFHD